MDIFKVIFQQFSEDLLRKTPLKVVKDLHFPNKPNNYYLIGLQQEQLSKFKWIKTFITSKIRVKYKKLRGAFGQRFSIKVLL